MEQRPEQNFLLLHNPAMNELFDTNFAELCKKLREDGKFTQKEMATKLGVTLNAYQKWEAGERQPSGKFAARILSLQISMQERQSQANQENKVKKNRKA